MSKKASSENEPSNALLMRTLTAMNAKFDRLPTLEHLNKMEEDLHAKIEDNTKTLRDELRAEFRSEIKQQAERVDEMIAEIKGKVENATPTTFNGRNDNQQGRYLRARRSFKVWPLNPEGSANLDDACLLYTSPSPRDRQKSRMPSSA